MISPAIFIKKQAESLLLTFRYVTINASYSTLCTATPLHGVRRSLKRRNKVRFDWRCGSVETCRNAEENLLSL